MLSPTKVTMASSRCTCTGSINPACDSSSNACSRALKAKFKSSSCTQKLMLNSHDDCVIKTIETLSLASALKTRAAIPTLPFMPGPDTVNIAKFSSDEMALTVSSLWHSFEITEPGTSGLWVFLISHGTPTFAHGKIVFGCKTLAPKYDSSIASL